MGPWYERAGSPIGPEINPYEALRDIAPSLGGSGQQAAHTLERRHFLLDQVAADCRSIRAGLGPEARERLDLHCHNLEMLEASVAATMVPEGPSCEAPEELGISPDANFNDRETRDGAMAAFRQLIALSFSCDITRVIGLSFGRTAARFAIPASYGVPSSGRVNSGDSGPQLHAWTHAGGENSNRARRIFFQWFSEQVAQVVDVLKETPDPAGGSLFDSTLVLWTSEMGAHSNPSHHPNDNIPVVLLGNACGELQPGRHYSGDNSNESCRTLHRLMTTVARHAGLPHVDGFGNLA